MFDPRDFQRTAVHFAAIATLDRPDNVSTQLCARDMANAAVLDHAEAGMVALLREAVEACPGDWTLRFAPPWQVTEQLSGLNVVVCHRQHIDTGAAVLTSPVPDARFFAFRTGTERDHNCVLVHTVDADEWVRRQALQQEQASQQQFDRPLRAKARALAAAALVIMQEANAGPGDGSEQGENVARHLATLETAVARLTGHEVSAENLLDPSGGFDTIMTQVVMAALALGLSPGYVFYMAEEQIRAAQS